MATPWHHSLSSARRFGGLPEDYLALHNWFDLPSKEIIADWRHRALRHHAQGIVELERTFGTTITLSTGKKVPTRLIGEQHVREDMGIIPSFADWARSITRQPWMEKPAKIDDEGNTDVPVCGLCGKRHLGNTRRCRPHERIVAI